MYGAFDVITKASTSLGIIGHPRELLYQVEPAGVETIIQSQDIRFFFQFNDISKVIILQFQALMSNSLKE
jgi:hypothetical protein